MSIQGEESVLGTAKYPAEFRNDAVELVRSSGRSFAAVARELGINQETLRHWVRSSASNQQPGQVSAQWPTGSDPEVHLRATRQLLDAGSGRTETRVDAPVLWWVVGIEGRPSRYGSPQAPGIVHDHGCPPRTRQQRAV